jgi:hypothetical protein
LNSQESKCQEARHPKGKGMFGCCYHFATGCSNTCLMNMRREENGKLYATRVMRCMCCWHQHQTKARKDNTVFPRARALVNHLHKYNRTISSKNSLVIKQQAILAKGMDGHCCTHSKGKWHCQNSAAHIQKWTFLGRFGNKNDQSFCNVHNHWY